MPEDVLIGQHLRDFAILERIGRGGMATVYRAHQPSVNRDVAIKVINLEDSEHDEQFHQRFAQEAELIARLEHIHILPVFDYGIENNLAFLVMRLLRGGSLQDLIRNGPMNFNRAAELFKQFASGLAYAHSKGIVHRDLKPSNILLDDAGNAYVTDFGLAKILGSSLELTHTDRIVGTPHYMSPEQLRGEPLTTRSDIYSLGVILYRMLAGRLPFEAQSSELITLIYQNLEKDPPLPTEVNPAIPHQVEDVILAALEKQAENRFATASEMADALDAALGRGSTQTGSRAARAREAARRAKAAQRRKRLLRIAAAGVAVILLIVAVLLGLVIANSGDEGRGAGENVPRILTGVVQPALSIIPDDEEVASARAYLGESGFIALIACNQTSEYHATHTREVLDFAAEYGLPLRIYDSQSDPSIQIPLIERARSEGAKGLIICSLDENVLGETLASAQAAGIRFVFTHSVKDSFGGVRLTGDNFALGRRPGLYAGEAITEELGGEADVIILDYPDLEDTVQRANGLESGVKETAPNVTIIGRYKGGTQDFGKQSVSRLLEQGITFDVILSINDAGAFGAIAALEEAGYRGDEVMIFSVDAEKLAQQYMLEGYFFRASVELGRTESAQAAVDAMVKLLAGAVIPENILTAPGKLLTREVLLSRAAQNEGN